MFTTPHKEPQNEQIQYQTRIYSGLLNIGGRVIKGFTNTKKWNAWNTLSISDNGTHALTIGNCCPSFNIY